MQDERRNECRAPSPQAAQEDGRLGIGGVDFPRLPDDFRDAADGLDADHLAENAVRSVAVSAAVVAERPDTRSIPDIALSSNPTGKEFLRYMVNSIWVSTATTIIGVAVAVPAAYAFSRFRFPGRQALFYSVLLRNMFPAVVFLMPLFIMMRKLHLINTHASLILTYLTFGLPLSIWLLKGFYDNIPAQLEQAARIDGATRFQAFLLIVMPLSSPGIIATAIYSFIIAWNEYVYALTFLNDKRTADAAGRVAALLHRVLDQLAGSDGGVVHHERAGRRAFPGPAEIFRPRAHRGGGQVVIDASDSRAYSRCEGTNDGSGGSEGSGQNVRRRRGGRPCLADG